MARNQLKHASKHVSYILRHMRKRMQVHTTDLLKTKPGDQTHGVFACESSAMDIASCSHKAKDPLEGGSHNDCEARRQT